MISLGEFVLSKIREQVIEDKIEFICSLERDTYDKLMHECLEENECTGAYYEGIHYDENILYIAYWHFYPEGDPWY